MYVLMYVSSMYVLSMPTQYSAHNFLAIHDKACSRLGVNFWTKLEQLHAIITSDHHNYLHGMWHIIEGKEACK